MSLWKISNLRPSLKIFLLYSNTQISIPTFYSNVFLFLLYHPSVPSSTYQSVLYFYSFKIKCRHLIHFPPIDFSIHIISWSSVFTVFFLHVKCISSKMYKSLMYYLKSEFIPLCKPNPYQDTEHYYYLRKFS